MFKLYCYRSVTQELNNPFRGWKDDYTRWRTPGESVITIFIFNKSIFKYLSWLIMWILELKFQN